MHIVRIRVPGATVMLGLRADLTRLLSVGADARSSFITSDEQLRWVLIKGLADPDTQQQLRLFWSQWSGDGERYVYERDRRIIDRLADQMVHGCLGAILLRDESGLYLRRAEIGFTSAAGESSSEGRPSFARGPATAAARATPFASVLAVESMSLKERLRQTMLRVPNYLTGISQHQFAELLTPQSLEFVSLGFGIWAAGHFFGVSEMLEAGLLLFGPLGVVLMGRALLDAIKSLYDGVEAVRAAKTEQDLNGAANKIAAAVAEIGVGALLTLLIYSVGKAAGEMPTKKSNLRQPAA